MSGRFFLSPRRLHTSLSSGPSETLRLKTAESQRARHDRKPRRGQLFVRVSGSWKFLDTPTLPMILGAVGVALVSKLLMMYDDAHSEELLEKKMKKAAPGEGTVRMLTREEWDEVREIRPRTPFESKIARSNARIRTGDPVRMVDARDWAVDVIMDGLTRAEEVVKNNIK